MKLNRTRRQSRLQSIIGSALLALLMPSLFAQGKGQFTAAQSPITAGPQLIVWTEVQKPQPVPPAVSQPAHETQSQSGVGVTEERSNSSSENRIDIQVMEETKQSVTRSGSVTKSSPQD
jgi:hypothetical protein